MPIKNFCLLLLLLLTLGLAPGGKESITLALLGDVMLGRGVAWAHPAGAGWEDALALLSSTLQSADLALANLESPVTSAPFGARATIEGRPPIDLRAGTQGLAALEAAGLDLLSIANNHSFDSGPAGVSDTQAALAAAGLTPLGPGPSLVRTSVGGLRLAFLAFTDVPAPLDIEAAARSIRQARRDGTRVVVSIHWGGEYRTGPSARQQQIARAFADAGASLVWGHHPHVLQPVEWIQGEGQDQATLVAYSLGNALFDQLTPPDARRGALILVKMDRAGVQSVQAIPFWIDVPGGRVRAANPHDSELIFRRLGEIVIHE